MSNPVVVEILACSPDEAFAAFCSARRLPRWVPGLLRARALRAREDGLPLDVEFTYRDEPVYRLLYSYDVTQRLVAWSPGPGARAGVRGFACFSSHPEGCELSYSVDGRAQRESANDVVAAFAAFLLTRPGSASPKRKPPRGKLAAAKLELKRLRRA